MEVASYREVEPVEEVKGVFRRDIITAGDGAPLFTMRVFEVEPGSSTPSHSHEWEHEVFILSGKGVVAGEPGGVMGRPSRQKPQLYVELRRHGQPINPLPWLAAKR